MYQWSLAVLLVVGLGRGVLGYFSTFVYVIKPAYRGSRRTRRTSFASISLLIKRNKNLNQNVLGMKKEITVRHWKVIG